MGYLRRLLGWQNLVQPPVWVVGVLVEVTSNQKSLAQVFFPHTDGHAHPLFSNDEAILSVSGWGFLAKRVKKVSVLLSLAGIVANVRPIAGEVLVQQGEPEPAG